ncbi:sigma-70 family RNA polymerase sigma factor [Acidithiobacillus sp. M4-SHS-6]|uniref:sigma-70 family RNA polymerase sigma factor n=1 Tax=Acidithiobacillus sp. M4-SHS-6 TaxID=3383024 RepID=UPI0039BDBE64
MVDEQSMNKAVDMVFARAREMHRLFPHIEENDFSQEGLVVVLEARERFESGFGAQFSTYVFPLIKSRMFDLVRKSGVVVISERDVDSGIRCFSEDVDDLLDSELPASLDSTLFEEETRDFWETAASALSDDDIDLLIAFIRGETLRDIVQETGLKLSTLQYRYQNLIREIRKGLGPSTA